MRCMIAAVVGCCLVVSAFAADEKSEDVNGVQRRTPPREVGDPTLMPAPTTLPTFRERVSPVDFEAQFEKALQRAQSQIANNVAPIASLEIERVYPNTVASKAKLGDYYYITGVDDKPITTFTQLMSVLDDKQAHRLQVLDPHRNPQTIDLPYARPLGVTLIPQWRLLIANARDRKTPAKWDDLLTVAAFARLTDTPLAETALKKATDLGCDHWSVSLIAFDIAMSDMRYDDALKLAPLVLKQAPEEYAPSIAERVAIGAILSYRIPFAIETLQPYDKDNTSERMKQLIAMADQHRKLPPLPRTNPAAYVGRIRSTDLYAEVGVIAAEARLQRHWENASRNNNVRFTLALPDRKMSHFNLDPVLRDGELRVTCKITPSTKESKAFRYVYFGLIDTARMNLVGAVEISDQGSPAVYYGEHPRTTTYLKTDTTVEHTIRLIFHDRDLEFLLDDTRLLYAPNPVARENREIGFCIQNQGMKLEVSDIKWLEYGDAAPDVVKGEKRD